jgi:hypothetical protein
MSSRLYGWKLGRHKGLNGAYDFRMIVEPDMSNHVIYDDVFGVFKDRFVALREAGAYDKVVAVENKHWGDSE